MRRTGRGSPQSPVQDERADRERRVIGIGAEDSGGSGANASMDPC